MLGPDRLARVSAGAVVPEQVVDYVRSVAGSTPRMFGTCVGYLSGGALVLVGYPLDDPLDPNEMAAAVDRALAAPEVERITVIGPGRPPQAPGSAATGQADGYLALPIPPPAPGPKLRTLLRRARRDVGVSFDRGYRPEHAALVRRYLDERPLSPGTRQIFLRLPDYLAASPDSLIVSARRPDGRLAAFAIGEFVSLSTAFFMFCFRDPGVASPGSADLALSGLLEEAGRRGQTRMNLGLGVSPGIRSFKAKWGAEPFLPYLETSWTPASRRPLRGVRQGAAVDVPMPRKSPARPGDRPGFWSSLREIIFGPPRLLDCIQVEVTSRCPGRCAYCPRTTRRADWVSRDMDLATFARLEPMLHRTGRVHLQGWGEPLLNPAFFDMAALARRSGCAVSTTTCGLCMDDVIAAGLVASGIDIAAFSFAGTDPESNRSRAGVDFDRVCDAIGRLAAAKAARGADSPAIHLAYLLLASNLEAVRGLPALMRRLSVQGAVVSTLDYIAAPGMEADAYLPHETDKIAAAADVLAETAAEAERLGHGFHFELPQASAPGTGCRENAARSLFVSADGLLSPCIYVNVPFDAPDPRRRVFGSIREEDPLAIWRKPEFRRFRDRVCGSDPDLPCRGCPKRFMG